MKPAFDDRTIYAQYQCSDQISFQSRDTRYLTPSTVTMTKEKVLVNIGEQTQAKNERHWLVVHMDECFLNHSPCCIALTLKSKGGK